MTDLIDKKSKFAELQIQLTRLKSEKSELESRLDELSETYFNGLIELQSYCTHNVRYHATYQKGEYYCTICMLTSRRKETFEDNKIQGEENNGKSLE